MQQLLLFFFYRPTEHSLSLFCYFYSKRIPIEAVLKVPQTPQRNLACCSCRAPWCVWQNASRGWPPCHLREETMHNEYVMCAKKKGSVVCARQLKKKNHYTHHKRRLENKKPILCCFKTLDTVTNVKIWYFEPLLKGASVSSEPNQLQITHEGSLIRPVTSTLWQ